MHVFDDFKVIRPLCKGGLKGPAQGAGSLGDNLYAWAKLAQQIHTGKTLTGMRDGGRFGLVCWKDSCAHTSQFTNSQSFFSPGSQVMEKPDHPMAWSSHYPELGIYVWPTTY